VIYGFSALSRSIPSVWRNFLRLRPHSSLKSSMASLLVGVYRTSWMLLTLSAALCHAESIRVRYPQGSSHGFVALKTQEGAQIATGEVTQTVRGDVVTSKLVFRFRDGSVDEDLTVFSQRGAFRLMKDHHVQHGPSFPKAIDVLIDVQAGLVTSRSEDGKVREEHMDMPDDLANGLPPNLLLNILPSTPETKVSYIAPGEKPRLIHLSIKPTGKQSFRVGGLRRTATDFTLHVELGGITGVVAPLIGKEPSDYHIWIMPGVPPAFIREEGALFQGGPIWTMEQISASFTGDP
jgi:hypothetical protein